MVVKKRL